MIDLGTLQAIVALKRCGKHTWKEIGEQVGLSWMGARGRYKRRPDDVGLVPCPLCGTVPPPSERHKVSFEEQGNYAEARSTSDRVQTLEELLAACDADLTVWKVADWGVKKWEVGAKIKEGHLEWDQGKLDGYLHYQGLGVQDLWSVWAKFVRIDPVGLQPVIQPVVCPVTYSCAEPPTDGSRRAFIIADVHAGYRKRIQDAKLVPFHDRRVLDIALQICASEQPGQLLFLGDTADCADWPSPWIKEPSFYFTTQPMILEVHWWLRQFRELCPETEIWIHQGNHDLRIDRALLTHLVAAYGLRAADELDLPPQMSLPRLWALHELGIKWAGDYPDDDVWLTDTLRAKHGNKVSQTGGGTAWALIKESLVSTLFGHCHRKESASKVVRTAQGMRTIYAFTPGCTCHRDGRVPGHKKGQNWQQGLGEVEYGLEGGGLFTSDTEVVDGVAIWKGKVYEGRDRVADLKRDLPEWNW